MAVRPKREKVKCSVQNCDKMEFTKGMCSAHDRQIRRHNKITNEVIGLPFGNKIKAVKDEG